jgi:uncharacterized protein YndB with AHSA1/START domain
MAEIYVAAEGHVAAPPEQVYTYIADHQQHHPNFLPPAFSDYRVETGGVGAGTVVSYKLKLGGKDRPGRARIAEPEPGRVITETLTDSDYVTTFTVIPDGDGTRVRIETRGRTSGIAGAIERFIVPRLLQPLYADELERLDRYAQSQPVKV